MKKRFWGLALAIVMLTGLLAGGLAEGTAPAVLTVAGSWEDCKAIEAVGRLFTMQYPECTIEYEYLQDYYSSLEKRMAGDEAADLFFTVNIQADSALLPYSLDCMSSGAIDLSNTFDGLIDNFLFREDGSTQKKLYAIPLGAEVRGLFVNKTLLASVGLDVPTDQASLLAACETLKQNGYIPFQGNPADFSKTLMYPWVCNLIANADDPQAAHDRVNAREKGLSEMFREPYAFLYTLIENGYYDYKRAQTELNLFTETTTLDYARYFLNIRQNGDVWEKVDDIGQVAFLPYTISNQNVMAKAKDDYHSQIDYAFILAPIGPEGGFAYMSPAHGIAVNKNSANLAWCEKFVDFLFQPENNILFADEFNIIPNTKEAFGYINTLFDIPNDRISQLGQVTFDYDFYKIITDNLLETSKGNNPKYMLTNADGSVALYPLQYYMDKLEESLTGNE